jgi:hypothetical protein
MSAADKPAGAANARPRWEPRGESWGIKKTAEKLGVSPRGLRARCTSPDHDIPYWFDGQYHFDSEDIYDYIAARYVAPAGAGRNA